MTTPPPPPAGPPPTVQIGVAARATRAVFDQILEPTRTPFEEWVVVNLVSSNQFERGELIGRMTAGLHLSPADAAVTIGRVIDAGLVTDDAPMTVTPLGQDLYDRTFSDLLASTQRIYGEIDADDLATTLRVLATVTQRADAELAST